MEELRIKNNKTQEIVMGIKENLPKIHQKLIGKNTSIFSNVDRISISFQKIDSLLNLKPPVRYLPPLNFYYYFFKLLLLSLFNFINSRLYYYYYFKFIYIIINFKLLFILISLLLLIIIIINYYYYYYYYYYCYY